MRRGRSSVDQLVGDEDIEASTVPRVEASGHTQSIEIPMEGACGVRAWTLCGC